MGTNYNHWNKWAEGYDSDGEQTSVKIPLSAVSDDYLRQIDFSNVTAECGKPMTEDEFKKYCSTRGTNETLLVRPNQPA